MEDNIMERMQEITDEYAQLPEMEYCDLTLEAADNGDIKVLITGQSKGNETAERVITAGEDLDFISETFYYPKTITPRSKPISKEGLVCLYYDEFGYLIVERHLSEERFKVNPDQREEVTNILRERFGKKLKA